MSTPIDDGGPAFPLSPEVGKAHFDDPMAYPGMTLRDYFATHADVTWAAVIETLDIKYPERDSQFTLAEIAECRAVIRFMEADAMIKARKKDQS